LSREVARQTLGVNPIGHSDGYGAKWNDYEPPAHTTTDLPGSNQA